MASLPPPFKLEPFNLLRADLGADIFRVFHAQASPRVFLNFSNYREELIPEFTPDSLLHTPSTALVHFFTRVINHPQELARVFGPPDGSTSSPPSALDYFCFQTPQAYICLEADRFDQPARWILSSRYEVNQALKLRADQPDHTFVHRYRAVPDLRLRSTSSTVLEIAEFLRLFTRQAMKESRVFRTAFAPYFPSIEAQEQHFELERLLHKPSGHDLALLPPRL
jgi:hypothetical protein